MEKQRLFFVDSIQKHGDETKLSLEEVDRRMLDIKVAAKEHRDQYEAHKDQVVE